jgi:two-component system chemotaxis response regulator CheB
MENFCKPAVDPMLRSLMHHYGHHILSIILTGMGNDGHLEVQNLVNAGGFCVAQNKDTSVVWGMPGAVAADGSCSALLAPDEFAPWIESNVSIK